MFKLVFNELYRDLTHLSTQWGKKGVNMEKKHNLIWIDLEMTGLEPATDVIIEIATIVTDGDLNILAEGPVLAIHQTNSLIDNMDDWNTKTHGNSGLVKRVKESKVDEAEAVRQTIEFLKPYVNKGVSPMCGNSVHQDRRFMNKYMLELEDYFHYRNLDVREHIKRWMISAKASKSCSITASILCLSSLPRSLSIEVNFKRPIR